MTTPVLGIYRRDAFNKTLRVGTPDPTKYHDAHSVRLEGAQEVPISAKLPGNEKFSLPGVVIPHAKREGGSMGWNSEAPMKVFIDPEQTGGQIQVDIGELRRHAEDFSRLSSQAQDENDIVETFARYSTLNEAYRPTPIREEQPAMREAPLQMRGSYVVPKATPGGGQVKAASFSRQPSPPDEIDPGIIKKAAAAANAATTQARSLHDELIGPNSIASVSNRPMRKVTFELPLASGASLGRFDCYYNDVVCDEFNLVLVNDNSNPGQVTWYPPPLENPDTGEPMGIAVLVHGLRGEEDALYLAFPTGVQFNYNSQTFALLTIDKRKTYEGKKS